MKVMVKTFNQTQLETAKAELQEMEKTMEKNLEQLQQQLEDVTAKVQALQEELSVVRPCTDGHYPEQAVKIILLQRSIWKLKQQQKEEIEKAEEMGKHILEQLEKKAQAEQEALLQKIMELCGVHVTSQHRDQFLGAGRQGRGCHTLPIST